MEFRLVYRGRLKGNSTDRAHKQEVRRAFHPQLKELWNQAPLSGLREAVKRETEAALVRLRDGYPVGQFRFVPVVSDFLYLTAHLDIVLLRPGPPGAIITQGGDIDNRLETLFDALRMPKANEFPDADAPGEGESPFYCLLEDDALVTGVSVVTDRLLDPKGADQVELLIHVDVKATRWAFLNSGIG